MKISTKAPLEQRQKIYRSLCYVLSERIDQVGWDEFTPADWELFGQMAEREGVGPLMYWKLKDSPVEVQPSTFNFLRSTYYQTLAQNTLMYQELERILTALGEAGIEVIVLKGAALAATVYEDIGLRPMGDLDLLVRAEKFDEARQLMFALGYRENKNYIRSHRIHELLAYHVRFIKDQREIFAELHWELIGGLGDRRSPPINWFWNQLDQFSSNPVYGQVFTLTPLAHLLHLVAHLIIKHGPEDKRLLWLYDIHNLIQMREAKIPWDEFLISAKGFGWLDEFFSLLKEVNSLFGTPISDEINKNYSRESSSAILIKIKRSHQNTRILNYGKKLRNLDWKTRIWFVLAIVFPSPIHIRKHYEPKPSWLWPLYYPYRWIEILADGINTLFNSG